VVDIVAVGATATDSRAFGPAKKRGRRGCFLFRSPGASVRWVRLTVGESRQSTHPPAVKVTPGYRANQGGMDLDVQIFCNFTAIENCDLEFNLR